MADWRLFPYVFNPEYIDDGLARPFLPVTLGYRQRRLEALALLDSGADLNVLPYRLGLELGADWDEQGEVSGLKGIGAVLESRSMVIDVTLAHWPTISMGFAWAEGDDLPVVLGQSTFFKHFDICFRRPPPQMRLEYRPRQYSP